MCTTFGISAPQANLDGLRLLGDVIGCSLREHGPTMQDRDLAVQCRHEVHVVHLGLIRFAGSRVSPAISSIELAADRLGEGGRGRRR